MLHGPLIDAKDKRLYENRVRSFDAIRRGCGPRRGACLLARDKTQENGSDNKQHQQEPQHDPERGADPAEIGTTSIPGEEALFLR